MVEYGAYRADKIYSVQQIKDVVGYAKQRGIKVIPELDQPAHSGKLKERMPNNLSLFVVLQNCYFIFINLALVHTQVMVINGVSRTVLEI